MRFIFLVSFTPRKTQLHAYSNLNIEFFKFKLELSKTPSKAIFWAEDSEIWHYLTNCPTYSSVTSDKCFG